MCGDKGLNREGGVGDGRVELQLQGELEDEEKGEGGGGWKIFYSLSKVGPYNPNMFFSFSSQLSLSQKVQLQGGLIVKTSIGCVVLHDIHIHTILEY